MMPVITERDESASVTRYCYEYTRVVETAGRKVRVRVRRDYYPNQCFAVAEVLADTMTWTQLAVEPHNNWVHSTPRPSPTIDAATELATIADRLIHRAAEILAPPPTTPANQIFSAVSALLATTYRYDGGHRITPDEIEWATSHGHPFHIIEHGDGSVTFTKEHRDNCPFITSTGTQECDDECYIEPQPRTNP